MLTGMKLHNCRQHHDTTLTFVKGVNTIVGPNNSGKSTIPEMIEFALYGAKALRDSAKGFITDGERDGSAIIQMNIGKHRYQIGRNSKDAELLKDGRDEASYKANVTKYVSALTGVSHGGFRLAHYVRQKELAAFSSLRPGKRQETVEKMLKINAVDRAIAVVKSQLDTSKALYDGFLRNVKDTEPEENELADLMLTHECTRQHPYELEPLELECSRTRDALRMADAIIARQDENGRIVERLLREAAELNLRLEKRPELEAQLKEVQEASAALGPISDEHLKELQVRLKELSDLELKDAEATEARKELALPPPDVMHAPIPVDSGPRDFAMAASATSRRAAESFKGLSGKSQCPTCLQPVEWKKEAQDVLDTAAKITAAEFDRLDIELTRAKREYQAQTRAHERYLQLIARRTLLVEQAMDTGYDPTAKVACALELEQCRNDREALARLQGKQNTTRVNLNRLEEDEARLASIATEIAAVEPEDPELVERQAQLADDCAAAEVEYKEMVELETVRRETLASLTGRIGELKAYVDGAAQVKALALTEAEILAMHQARQAQFTKFKRYMTAKIRPILQEVAEALFHKVTKNRYASFQLGMEYDIVLVTHRGFIRRLAAISGSENDLANLCLRLAIATMRANKLAGSLGFIILDEICSSFDERRTKQTLEGLLELRDVIPQIINITHTPVEARYADKLFTVSATGDVATVTCS